MRGIVFCSAVSVISLFVGCNKGSDKKGASAGLALVKPPVQDSTPAGLLGSGMQSLALISSSSSEFQERFFNPQGGPTHLLRILADVDSRIAGINLRTQEQKYACATQTPVEYTISPMGTPITMYAQCYGNVSVPDGSKTQFEQWGKKDDTTYIFTHIGAGNVAAIVKPIAGTTDKYRVDAWMSVGLTNTPAWDKMSYGVMQVMADSSINTMEMTVAGSGFGFCGAQFKSDGNNIYFKGSADGPRCQETTDLCVTAADMTVSATCTDAQKTFGLPAIGRKAANASDETPIAASKYPENPNIGLDGTLTDVVHFGPTEPTAGAGAM